MEGFGPGTFGELNADDYDAVHDPGTTTATVDLLAELYAPGSKVLELAIGSGRIALPLAARGYGVAGVEGSPEMVDLMRAKPGGRDIAVDINDMAAADGYRLAGPFDHAFLVYNTLFNLVTQDAQVQVFRNVAACIKPGGTFLVETFVPRFDGFVNDQRVSTKRLDMHTVWLEAAVHNPVHQTLEMQRLRITPDGTKLVPLPMRYAYPAEIDLMAALEGMHLVERWGGWAREPYTARSDMHVSLYRL